MRTMKIHLYPSNKTHKPRPIATGFIRQALLLGLFLLLASPLFAAENVPHKRVGDAQNAAGAGGISAAGMVESRSGGFKFPDNSVQTSAVDLASHTANGSAHHTRYTDSEAVSAVDLPSHTANSSAHHARYADSEAVAAIKAADGTGSGVDADLLDGMHASEVIDAAINAVRTPISTLPYTINQPGSYYVTGNLDGSGGGITISASDVTLDLMGFTLDGGGSVNDSGIGISVVDNVTIINGTVRGFGRYGISQGATSGGIPGNNTRILNLRVIDNGSLISHAAGISTNAPNSLVSGCTVIGHPGSGISVSGTATVRNNLVQNNGRSGISHGSLIVGNVVANNGSGGSNIYYAIKTSNAVIRNNVVRNNQYSGISGSNLLVENNLLESNNLSEDANGGGIVVIGESRVVGNVLKGNKINGIRVSSYGNVIIDNHITRTNPGNGINFTISSNFYRDNTAYGNGTDFNLGGFTITDGGGNVGF